MLTLAPVIATPTPFPLTVSVPVAVTFPVSPAASVCAVVDGLPMVKEEAQPDPILSAIQKSARRDARVVLMLFTMEQVAYQ
jgi:hypothetical protein